MTQHESSEGRLRAVDFSASGRTFVTRKQSGASGSCCWLFPQQSFIAAGQSSTPPTNDMSMVQKYRCSPAVGRTATMSANRMVEKQRIVTGRDYRTGRNPQEG
jgi:hypothetical protein